MLILDAYPPQTDHCGHDGAIADEPRRKRELVPPEAKDEPGEHVAAPGTCPCTAVGARAWTGLEGLELRRGRHDLAFGEPEQVGIGAHLPQARERGEDFDL